MIVSFAHRRQMFIQTRSERRGVAHIATAFGRHFEGEEVEILVARRQGVGLPVFLQLQAMFHVAQKLVSGSEAGVLGIGEQTFVAQAEQSEHGAAVAHPRLASAVQALEALHQKLDVADAPGSQFNIEPTFAALFRGGLLADALARLGDGFHGAEVERTLVNQRLDKFQQARAGLRFARGNTRFDEHLLFPIAGAPGIIGPRSFIGDADFAEGAVGPQAQIHAIAQAVGGVGGK